MAESKSEKLEPIEAPQVVTTAQPMTAGTPHPPQYAPWPGQPTGPWAQQPNQVVPIIAQQTSTNIVVNTQPGAGRQAPREWTSGLCDCCSDMGSCFLAAFCPCWLICMLAQDMGDDCCNAFCYAYCNFAGTFGLRVYLRGKENIRGSLFDDFNKTVGLCSICTSCCALAQVAREVKVIKSIRGSV